jgi:hypothetical protein
MRHSYHLSTATCSRMGDLDDADVSTKIGVVQVVIHRAK